MRRMEVAILAGVVLLGGCATKRYVADRVDPVNTKVGEVEQKQQQTSKRFHCISLRSTPHHSYVKRC